MTQRNFKLGDLFLRISADRIAQDTTGKKNESKRFTCWGRGSWDDLTFPQI